MKNDPLVSIAAINYNNGRFLLENLNSIGLQSYRNIEIIIVDDFSTDNSIEIINQWISQYNGVVKTIFHDSNLGIHAGLNNALRLSSGEYFSLIATDDVMMYDKIEKQINSVRDSHEEIAMVYGDSMMIDENSQVIIPSMFEYYCGKDFVPPSGNIFRKVLSEFYFFTQASLINLNILKKIKYEFDKNIISEDWDIELFLSRNYKLIGINDVCTKYRKVTTSQTSVNWNSEKIHKVYKSHFLMFRKYLYHPSNNNEDKKAIIEKMISMYWFFFYGKNSKYIDKIYLTFILFKNTKNIKYLLLLFLITFRFEFMISIISKIR